MIFRLGTIMIYLNIQELIASRQVQWGRRVTLTGVSDATGISRMTLHRMIHQKSHNTITDHLDKLCDFFRCDLTELVKYVPNQNINDNPNLIQKVA